MQSTKSTYCFTLCLFAIIFFVNSKKVIANETAKEYPTILVGHTIPSANSLLNPAQNISVNVPVSYNYSRLIKRNHTYLSELTEQTDNNNIHRIDDIDPLTIENTKQIIFKS